MSLAFSDTSTKAGLIQECESLIYGDTGYGVISGNTDLLATFTRYINEALNRVVSLIMKSDGRWQWDDNNNTDLPIGTATVTTDQQDYSLAVTHLQVTRVEIKDSAGNWHLLQSIDQADVFDQSLTDFMSGTGLPIYYDKIGQSLFLYPTPDYTQASSLKVWFTRPPSYFTVSDTTKVPGFNSLFHRLVALIAARDFALTKNMSIAKSLSELVAIGEDDLQATYSVRSKDEHIGLRARVINGR